MVQQAVEVDNDSIENDIEKRIVNARFFLEKNHTQIINLRANSWTDNRVYFDALAKILFYTKDEIYTVLLEDLYWKLAKTKFANEGDRTTVFDFYMRDRNFVQATNFRQRLPDWQSKKFPIPPKITFPVNLDLNNKIILSIKDAKTLEPMTIDPRYTGLIVFGSPNCHFTENALKSILQNKKRFPSLKEKVHLVVPQENVDFKQIVLWNSRHSDLSYKLIYKEDPFKEFSFSSVPKFYFLKDGKIVEEISGWPKEGRLLELANGFQKIGFN